MIEISISECSLQIEQFLSQSSILTQLYDHHYNDIVNIDPKLPDWKHIDWHNSVKSKILEPVGKFGHDLESIERQIITILRYQRKIDKIKKSKRIQVHTYFNNYKCHFISSKNEFETDSLTHTTVELIETLANNTGLNVIDIKDLINQSIIIDGNDNDSNNSMLYCKCSKPWDFNDTAVWK